MGSSSSKPEYPFPVPAPPHRSKSAKWSSLSMKKRKGKEREKYEDFIVPRYPTPTAAYGFPYQYQSAFPTYYAAPQGVQMAFLQPFGVQQPILAMPQPYVPVAAYQTTAAPVQPAVAPAHAFRPAPASQMPVPAPATTPALIPVPAPAPAPVVPPPSHSLPSAPTQMPAPVIPSSHSFGRTPSAPTQIPAPVIPSSHSFGRTPSASTQMPAPVIPPPSHSFSQTPSAPTQMPQPYQIPEQPPNHGSVIPRTPVIADPVIPPPPIVTSEPRSTSDARPRFTGFYRPADLPVDEPEPVRPPTAGPAGRTPFPTSMPMPEPSSTPMPMPTPMPTSTSNPLPAPPADVWDTSPYRQVLANLPTDVSTLLDLQSSSNMLFDVTEPVPRPSSRLGTLFGSSSNKDKGKGTLKGLFRSKSTSTSSGSRHGHGHGHGRTQTMTSIVIPAPGPSTMPMPAPTHGPPIKFDHTGDYAGFVNHSPHRVMFKNRMYPTALHLLEAMKFEHRPDLQERVRTCKDVNDMYPLSASFHDHVRSDWGQVFLQTMEDVLYLKFKQHPTLRTLLLHTGLADIIYKDENTYWGEGLLGEGANELGKALVHVRERLRQEGER